MKRDTLLALGALLAALSFAAILLLGSTCTLRVPLPRSSGGEYPRVELEQEEEILRLTEQRQTEDALYLTFRSVSRGKAYVTVWTSEDIAHMTPLYVHRFGVITMGHFLGASRGSRVIPAAAGLWLLLLLWSVIRQFRRDMRESLYRYRNIRNLGWIIFLVLLLLALIPFFSSGNSLNDAVHRVMSSAASISILAFPIAFLLFFPVTVSSLRLLRKEGRSWRNMLGFLLGLFVCLGTIFPHLLSELLQRSTVVDVHNEQGLALYVELAVTNGILAAVSYLECILWGTILLTVRAAKRIPAFDKDCILILGCQIRKDGSLTPLLKGRADRALAFARMQEEAGGKPLLFVPSGGQGPDETMPEGRAVGDYLLAAGVPAQRILVEDRSANTEENFRCSLELLRRERGLAAPKLAFSTTNYHVFRSGLLAGEQGIRAEGIGSRTRSYFWINAFVREFVATLYAERRKHLRVILLMLLMLLALILVRYLSNRI